MARMRAAAAVALVLATCLYVPAVFGQPAPTTIARVGARVTSAPTSRPVQGSLFALDQGGRAISELTPDMLQANVDGAPAQLNLSGARPSIALAAALWLDSSASSAVRDALANALADGVQGIDVNRDTLAVASTADASSWDQVSFSNSAPAIQDSLNQVIQSTPRDDGQSLEQISNVLRALAGQQRDTRVLLLFTNRALASAASINASLGTLRAFAVDNSIQVSIVALPGSGAAGPAEALAEGTPGGRVEYVFDATNREDLAQRISLLLAPALGAREFSLTAPVPFAEGTHTLSLGAPGAGLQATTTFQVVTLPVQIDSFVTTDGTLQPDASIGQPTWIEVRQIGNASIDSVEWTLDGRVTEAAASPWALLVDPEQLSDGEHQIAARIISEGRAGPLLTATFVVPPDFLRSVRNVVRGWGVIALLLLGELIVIVLFVRVGPASRGSAPKTVDFPPTLRLNPLAGRYLAPEVIEFPTSGKLRVGYHPPFVDNQVGSREFARLPYQDIRGDEETVKDLSRHAACIWRDPKTNDCYIQLGWNGPGEHIRPRPQSQVFHFGRPQDATSTPFRLAHHDVVRLSNGVEFVFNQVGLRDKATPDSKKLGPLELPRVVRSGG